MQRAGDRATDARFEIGRIARRQRAADQAFDDLPRVVLLAEVPPVQRLQPSPPELQRHEPRGGHQGHTTSRGPVISAAIVSVRWRTSSKTAAANGTIVNPTIVYRASTYWRAVLRTTRRSTMRSKSTE